MKRVAAGLFVFCVLSYTAFAQTRNNVSPARPGGPATGSASRRIPPPVADGYTISPEDVLAISVWKEPDLVARVAVRSDGMIGLPLLNDVFASGLTTDELMKKLTEAFSRFVNEPIVTVNPVEIHSQVVYVFGSVARQGEFPLGRPLTVMELLARSGGFAEYANAKDIQIIRTTRDPSTNQDVITVHRFNYKEYVESRNFKQNILLRSGDFIIVP
ncbi:MAG: sugar transporter [Acidobacteria bacterium]|nr:MAG: sugar transporter [Acidobacteriota bacterium]